MLLKKKFNKRLSQSSILLLILIFMHKEDDDQSQIICQNVVAPLSGLEIATDTVADTTKLLTWQIKI